MSDPQLPRRSPVFRVLLPIALVLIAAIGLWQYWLNRKPQAQQQPVFADPSGTVVNSIGMKLVPIAAGEFLMGTADPEGAASEKPQHSVRISQPFFMGMYEVMRVEFKEVMGFDPSTSEIRGSRNRDRYPVETVGWEDAVEFCRRLSEMPAEQTAGRSYRLPTEAEWEYACRAGTTTAFHVGETLTTEQAHFDATKSSGPIPIGSYAPNAFGLYDMHGNLQEWCADWYGEDAYENSPIQDPQGPQAGNHRVVRGGSWWSIGTPHQHRCAARQLHFEPTFADNTIGFRVVCTMSDGDR